MPPYCDTRGGPVVKAAKRALETGNLNYVLIWILWEFEKELKEVFKRTLRARNAGKDAQDVADDWLFETAIRLQRTRDYVIWHLGINEKKWITPTGKKASRSRIGKDSNHLSGIWLGVSLK